ncbi:hypothetical protein D9M73_124640 [compost metagenome]
MFDHLTDVTPRDQRVGGRNRLVAKVRQPLERDFLVAQRNILEGRAHHHARIVAGRDRNLADRADIFVEHPDHRAVQPFVEEDFLLLGRHEIDRLGHHQHILEAGAAEIGNVDIMLGVARRERAFGHVHQYARIEQRLAGDGGLDHLRRRRRLGRAHFASTGIVGELCLQRQELHIVRFLGLGRVVIGARADRLDRHALALIANRVDRGRGVPDRTNRDQLGRPRMAVVRVGIDRRRCCPLHRIGPAHRRWRRRLPWIEPGRGIDGVDVVGRVIIGLDRMGHRSTLKVRIFEELGAQQTADVRIELPDRIPIAVLRRGVPLLGIFDLEEVPELLEAQFPERDLYRGLAVRARRSLRIMIGQPGRIGTRCLTIKLRHHAHRPQDVR